MGLNLKTRTRRRTRAAVPSWPGTVRQKAVWNVQHLAPGRRHGDDRGNLVLQGQMDGKFNAYAPTAANCCGPSMRERCARAADYLSVDGKQYISVLTGVNGSSVRFWLARCPVRLAARGPCQRLLTFALDGKAELPASARRLSRCRSTIRSSSHASLVESGKALFGKKLCLVCHALAPSRRVVLRIARLALVLSAPAFTQVVRGGMPGS